MAKNYQQPEEYDVNSEEIIRRAFTCDNIKSIDEDKRQIDFIISTDRVDRMGDIITVNGWQLKEFRRNPVILFAHNSRVPPIGRAIKVGKADGALTATGEFMEPDLSEFADSIYRMYLGGYMRAVSVGFKPIEWERMEDDDERFTGIKFTKHELLEFSAVPVPANPDALIAARSAGINTRPLKEWAEMVLDDWGNGEDLLLNNWGIPKSGVEFIQANADGGSRTISDVGVNGHKSEDRQEGFVVQSVLGKKGKWSNKSAFMKWARNHKFKTGKVDETDKYWRLRQKEPSDFKRLRTTCLNPGDASASSDDCKVLATGGPMKSAEEIEEKSEDLIMLDNLELVSKDIEVGQVLLETVSDGKEESIHILQADKHASFDRETCDGSPHMEFYEDDDGETHLKITVANGEVDYLILGTDAENNIIAELSKSDLAEAYEPNSSEKEEDKDDTTEEDDDPDKVEASAGDDEDTDDVEDKDPDEDDVIEMDFGFMEDVLAKFEEFLDKNDSNEKSYTKQELRKIKFLTIYFDDISVRLRELVGEEPTKDTEEGRSSKAKGKSNGHDTEKMMIKLADVEKVVSDLVPKLIDKGINKKMGRLD